jgi:hypothetical protein
MVMVIAGQSSFPALGDNDQIKISDSPNVDREGHDRKAHATPVSGTEGRWWAGRRLALGSIGIDKLSARWIKNESGQQRTERIASDRGRGRPTLACRGRAPARAAFEINEDWGTLVWLVMTTGVRRGEVCALRWRDVDLDAETIEIRRNYVLHKGVGVEKDTKTQERRS